MESISLVDPLLRGTGVRVLDDAGKTLDRVTATTVDIVNSGRSGIRGADVLPGRRGFPDALVLDVAAGAPLTVVRTEIDDDHQSHIDPRIEEISVDGEPFWKLDFNVLGPGDGFRVALLHDGAEVERLELVGHLLDGEIIQGSAAGRAEFFGLVASDIKRVTISIPFLGSITYGTDHD